MAILEVENLKKSFDALDVLKGISFSLNKGEALSIIGSSGSGKTTTAALPELPGNAELRQDHREHRGGCARPV